MRELEKFSKSTSPKQAARVSDAMLSIETIATSVFMRLPAYPVPNNT